MFHRLIHLCDCPTCNGSGIEGGFTSDLTRHGASSLLGWPKEAYNGHVPETVLTAWTGWLLFVPGRVDAFIWCRR